MQAGLLMNINRIVDCSHSNRCDKKLALNP
jgi:hypothetical protein